MKGEKVCKMHKNAYCIYVFMLLSSFSAFYSCFGKVFFFKAVLKAANVSTQEQSSFKTGNCLWLSKDELEQLLPKEYFDSISSVLSQ